MFRFPAGLLRQHDPDLPEKVEDELQITLPDEYEWVEISNTSKLSLVTYRALQTALNVLGAELEAARVTKEAEEKAAIDISNAEHVEKFKQACKAVDDHHAREAKRKSDEDAGQARLLEYVKVGLEDTQENLTRITDFLSEKAKGYMSASNVDVAIKCLGNKLTWRKSEPPKPQAPSQPVVKLSDGSDQLPLGTVPSYQHTKEQLKDLAKREATAKSRSSFGSRF